MKKNVNRKQAFIEAFRKATQEHTHNCSTWDSKLGHSVETPFPYPIPAGKYTIDENFSRNEISIRCKRCWTDDLLAVAKKVAPSSGREFPAIRVWAVLEQHTIFSVFIYERRPFLYYRKSAHCL